MLRTRSPLLLFLALLTTGCPAAVHRTGDDMHGRFSFQVEPGWELHRNHRFLGSHHVTLLPDPPRSVLSVDLLRVGDDGRDLPLDLVAEGAVGNLGRRLGMRTTATHEHEILLAGRRAIALTGLRQHGPQQAEFTAWVTRTERHLLIVMLQTPPGELQQQVRLLERLLETFELPEDPPPPDIIDGA